MDDHYPYQPGQMLAASREIRAFGFGILMASLLPLLLAACKKPAGLPAGRLSIGQQIQKVSSGALHEVVIDRPLTAQQLNQLIDVAPRLSILTIQSNSLDSPAFKALLERCQSLERLRCDGVVSDSEMQVLARCASLKVLNLPNGTFSNAGLDEIAGLPNLELLRIHSANMTDAGLGAIARLPALRFLHLIDVPVTDAGLKVIAGMDRLESFYLDGGNCSDEGLSELIRKRFDLHFHWNDLHLDDDPNAHPH